MYKLRLRKLLLMGVVLSFIFTPVLWAEEETLESLRKTSKAFTAIAKEAVNAVVAVQAEVSVRSSSPFGNSPFEDDFFDFFFGPGSRRQTPQKQTRQGSGFIISPEGYIMTNNHMVENADKISVTLKDGRKFDAKIIGTDDKTEVAVIKIETANLPTIELGDSDALEIGEWVIAVGNPFGLSESVTVGVVSAKSRSGFEVTDYEDFIQTDAAINPGNSGGPLLNLDGQAIGINTFIVSQSGGYMGIGFAIPINMAKAIADQFIKGEKLDRGYIGVAMNPTGVTPELAELFGLEKPHGALVAEVTPDSPAQKAGLKPGDIIIEINGKEVLNNSQLKSQIAFTKPGTEIELTIWRNHKKERLTVEVKSQSENLLATETSEVGQKFGLGVQDLTGELAERFRYTGENGVIVAEVKPNSPADAAGIQPGMVILSVNRVYVNSVAEFNTAIAESAKTKKALLLIKSSRYAQYIVLSIE